MKDITFITVGAKGKVTQAIPRTRMTVSGREKLANEVAKALLTTAGTNAFNSEYGSGFASLSQYVFEDEDDARNIIISMIRDVEKSIQNNQAGQDLPAEETLKNIEIGDVSIADANVYVSLYIVNLVGTVYNVNISTD